MPCGLERSRRHGGHDIYRLRMKLNLRYELGQSSGKFEPRTVPKSSRRGRSADRDEGLRGRPRPRPAADFYGYAYADGANLTDGSVEADIMVGNGVGRSPSSSRSFRGGNPPREHQ